jgi:formamidopyrimidine-DNA glycosylase
VPELPEVETVVRDLRPHLIGRRLDAIRTGTRNLRKPWRPEWADLLQGKTVEAVRRRGKWIVLDLAGDLHLVMHLGMTGQLTETDATAPVADHTHLVIDLQQPGAGRGSRPKRQLRFRDIRRFGSATLFSSADAVEAFFQKSALGPEPFGLDATYWRQRLKATRRCLKAVLLDQRVIAGVGNIYADEALFEARLHPGKLARSLSAAPATRLRQAIETVLTRAIERRGSTIRDYVGGSGLQGGYQEEFRVYGRTGKSCPRCGTAIRSVRLAGRSSHFCPRCQRK